MTLEERFRHSLSYSEYYSFEEMKSGDPLNEKRYLHITIFEIVKVVIILPAKDEKMTFFYAVFRNKNIQSYF